MKWPETDRSSNTTFIMHPDESNLLYAIAEDCAADIHRAPRLDTPIKLGERFEDIDYTALTHELWDRYDWSAWK